MSRRYHHYRRKHKEEDIDVTPLLNVMVVLIAFLIFSAVFSRITIQEIVLPTEGGGGGGAETPQITIEVILRHDRLEVGDGNNVVATLPMRDGKYDTPRLSRYLLDLKERYPDKQDINILLEPDIEYDAMIQVMDAAKIAVIPNEGQAKPQKTILFPQVSLGDAP